MNALTLTEPWATLVAIGAKRIETRSWSTQYRGSIAIHAAKGMTLGDLEYACTDPCEGELMRAGITIFRGGGYSHPLKDAFPQSRGCVIAIAELYGCRRIPAGVTPETMAGFPEHEYDFGDYASGRYAWLLRNVEALPEPIPARGMLGLWEWEPPVELRGAA